ncbi:hypothetical protein NADE_005215 [Nannochloris sp. 'desiccata']|nr:hypothetical protein KSW81_001167 [Chlorella desiccata (nom. nud.)]KAH7622633.1 hypothetical protein NADE_005215 [Chlorella desiccata (nom. nud.)]
MTINNYAKACADPVNNKCPTPPTNCNDFCKACDLYVNHIQGKTGVFTETSERGGHRLVVPIAPCRGVEDWKEKKCGGEDIWDHAWGFAGGPDFGLAVNPVQRRSQHQLHIHIAKLQQGLLPALRDIAKNKDTSWTPIVCNPKVATKCKVDKKATTSGLQAKFIAANSPSAAKPFQVAYGNSANEDNDVTVVAQPLGPGKGVVVLRANDRPAECFLYCQDVCQDRCT